MLLYGWENWWAGVGGGGGRCLPGGGIPSAVCGAEVGRGGGEGGGRVRGEEGEGVRGGEGGKLYVAVWLGKLVGRCGWRWGKMFAWRRNSIGCVWSRGRERRG